MKSVLMVLLLSLLSVNGFAGFDAGGGPGIKIERLIDFFKSVPKYLIEGAFIGEHSKDTLKLTTYQKANASGLSADSSASIWADIVQTDLSGNFIILVIGKNDSLHNVTYIVVEFDQLDIEHGNLIFNLKEHAKTYVFDSKSKVFIQINFKDYYMNLCDETGCPKLHFLSMMPKE